MFVKIILPHTSEHMSSARGMTNSWLHLQQEPHLDIGSTDMLTAVDSHSKLDCAKVARHLRRLVRRGSCSTLLGFDYYLHRGTD